MNRTIPDDFVAILRRLAAKNADTSYGLATVTATALLLEHPNDQDQWDGILRNNLSGLTGFQAGWAKATARSVLRGEIR